MVTKLVSVWYQYHIALYLGSLSQFFVGNSHNKIPDASLPEAERSSKPWGDIFKSLPVEGFFRYPGSQNYQAREEASEKCLLSMAAEVGFFRKWQF